MTKAEFSSFTDYYEYSPEEMKKRSAEFYAEMKRRRTVRQFSDRPVPREIIEDCLRTAATAPSGANLQPWSFIVVTDPAVKRQIRKEAEKTEREFYHKSATRKWVEDLKHKIGTAIFMNITSARTYNLYMPRIDCLMSNHLHFMAVPDREVSMGKVFK